MSTVLLGHTYALKCWRKLQVQGRLRPARVHAPFDHDTFCGRWREIRSKKLPLLPSPHCPVEVVVRTNAQCHRMKYCQSHTWSTTIHADAVVKLEEELLLSTPEFALVQYAQHAEVALVTKAIMEACGTYAKVEGTVHYNLLRLTTLDRLAQFAWGLESNQTTLRFLEALNYAAEGSASPMETQFYLLAYLPVHLGGYLDRRPVLNASLAVPDTLCAYAKRSSIVADFYHEAEHVAVEYDSTEFHAGTVQATLDERKRVIYGHLGITVRSLTSNVLLDAVLFDEFIAELAQALRCKFMPKTGADAAARDRLRARLLD